MTFTKLELFFIGLGFTLLGVSTTLSLVTLSNKPITYYTYFCSKGTSYANIKDYKINGNTLYMNQTLLGTPLKDASVVVVLEPGCELVPQAKLVKTYEELSMFMDDIRQHKYKGN